MPKANKEIIIRPKSVFSLLDLEELYRYRELLYIFAWRDIKVRYKQTLFGATWALFQPLFSMFVFTVFFGQIAKIPSGDLPYSLFVLIGLVFWTFFSGVLTNESNSFIENEHIVKKVYFPRIILPLSKVFVGLVDFFIGFIMLLLTMLVLGFSPNLLFLSLAILGIIIASFGASGLGLFLASFNVKFRDVRYALPFFIQMLVFFTPVIYPTSIMRESFRYLISINPMSGVVEAIRASLTMQPVNAETLLISSISSGLLFIGGLIYFRLSEKSFADIL